MSLSVEGRHCGTVYVLRCSGRVVAGEESVALEASINRGLHEFRRLVIDLGGVIRIDSTSIGLLVRYLSHTRSRGGDLRLSAAPPAVGDLLRATKLTTVFKVYDSEEEAITSLLKNRRFRAVRCQPGHRFSLSIVLLTSVPLPAPC